MSREQWARCDNNLARLKDGVEGYMALQGLVKAIFSLEKLLIHWGMVNNSLYYYV